MTLGNIAYDAWRGSLEDETKPTWEDIEAPEKIAWEYAAETIRELVVEKRMAPQRVSLARSVR